MVSCVQLPNEHYKAKLWIERGDTACSNIMKMINGRGYILIEPSAFNKIWMGKTERKDHPGRGNGVATIHSYFSKGGVTLIKQFWIKI